MAAVSMAAVVMTGCQPGDTPADGDGASSKTPTATTSSPPLPLLPAPPPPAGSGSNGAAAKACSPDSLKASAYQAADRPAGTGTGAAIVQFTNAGAKSCVLQGHPTVAGAANGSRNSMCR